MIRLKKFRKMEFPDEQDAYISSTLLPMFVTGQAKKTFNKTFPLDCPPEEVAEKRYAHNNSLKTRLYNMVAKLKRQAPGSLPQQTHQRKTVLNLKGTHRLTPTELYFRKIHTEPSFVHALQAEKERVQAVATSNDSMVTQSGSGDGSHPKNKKQQERWKLAKEWLASAPEEVRLEIEALALEDADQKKRMLEEGTPESIQRALQKIELMGSEIMKVVKEAGVIGVNTEHEVGKGLVIDLYGERNRYSETHCKYHELPALRNSHYRALPDLLTFSPVKLHGEVTIVIVPGKHVVVDDENRE
ncbi:hypothetical protein EDD18DRAFT_1098915 [Armillaria luteobubalina]|uniref:Uncharacterized protein n=1 Tax=Armillaria luteobubalina TaxID=153913 RepID=A0AA39QPQ3_9AGAR|nr:hypothetical protein EDD18DRAFT_1098915 [Armillaria luteobubalina]